MRPHLAETQPAYADDLYQVWRERFLAQNIDANAEVLGVLQDYHRRVVGELTAGGYLEPGAVVSETGIRNALASHTEELRRQMQQLVQRQILTVADLTLLREQDVLKPLLELLPEGVGAAILNAIPRQLIGEGIVDLLFEGTLGYEINLSQTLWVIGEMSQDQVLQVVNYGLSQGKHATEVAKDLERVLVPQARAKDVLWSRANAPKRLRDVIGRVPAGIRTRSGTVSYNYLRIAREEMRKAQRAAHLVNVMGLQRALPFKAVNGVKWNLSTAHEIEDICDEWASDDPEGLGPGVYSPPNVPIGHIQDMCFTTSELISIDEFQRGLDRYADFFAQPLNYSEARMAQVFDEVLTISGAEILGAA